MRADFSVMSVDVPRDHMLVEAVFGAMEDLSVFPGAAEVHYGPPKEKHETLAALGKKKRESHADYVHCLRYAVTWAALLIRQRKYTEFTKESLVKMEEGRHHELDYCRDDGIFFTSKVMGSSKGNIRFLFVSGQEEGGNDDRFIAAAFLSVIRFEMKVDPLDKQVFNWCSRESTFSPMEVGTFIIGSRTVEKYTSADHRVVL